MYVSYYEYIAELEKGTNKVSRAFNGPKSIGELLDPIRKMMAAFHRILALSAPVHCLCLTADDSTVSVEAKEVRPHAARTPPPLRASSSPYPCAIANASAFHPFMHLRSPRCTSDLTAPIITARCSTSSRHEFHAARVLRPSGLKVFTPRSYSLFAMNMVEELKSCVRGRR